MGEILARHLACLGELPDEDRAALAALRGHVREVKRHKDILRPEDRPGEVIVVLDGLLCRYGIGAGGVRQIYSFYVPTEAPCLETLYIDYMDNSLGAVVDSRIGLIPHEDLYEAIDKRPEVRKLIWRQTLVQAAIFREWLTRNSKMPAHVSLAHFFCEYFARARAAGQANGDSCELPITQELLADALGLTPVHTNRTLMVLRETGAVEWRGGTLTVNDWNGLVQIANWDPRYLHMRCDGIAAGVGSDAIVAK